jgi:hypothetical protein
MTKREGGRKLFRDLILNNVVSCSVSAPSTHTDEVMAIANSSKTKIPVKQLHKCLDSYVASRGSVFFGFPGDCLDRIVRNYKDLWWWISTDGLKMGVLAPSAPRLSGFDELAGRLMCEALAQKEPNGRIRKAEYLEIALALDEAGFRPVLSLDGLVREKLAERNKTDSRNAIKTFERATNSKLSWLRRGVQKRLYRSAEKYRRAHPESSQY